MSNEYTAAAPCSELPETMSEEYDNENGLMTSSVTLRCAYADRHTVAGDICANRRLWPKGAYGIVPKASRASIKAEFNVGSFTSGSQMFIPQTALVTIYYSTQTADIITESVEPIAQSTILDHKLFAWGSANGEMVTEEEAPGMLVRGMNLVRNSYYVQLPLDPNLLIMNGFVNNAAFSSTLLGLTFDVETLLFGPPVINRKINSNGVQQFDVTKKWSWQPSGWNTYWRARDQSWQQMYVRQTGQVYKQYEPGDMSSLLSW